MKTYPDPFEQLLAEVVRDLAKNSLDITNGCGIVGEWTGEPVESWIQTVLASDEQTAT